MNIKILTGALAVALGTLSVSPADVEAKSNHNKNHHKNSSKQHHKSYHSHKAIYGHKKASHDNHRGYGSGYRSNYNYSRPRSESYGIYTTPGGGLGFHYSENRGPSYGSPYRYGSYGGYGYF